MIKINYIALIKVVTVFFILLNFVSCSSDPDSPGLEYMPDMYRSPAIEPYVDYAEIRGRENKEIKLKRSAKRPPYGSIPYVGTDSSTVSIMMPYNRKAHISMKTTHGMYDDDLSEINQYDLAVSDKNPLKLTLENSTKIFEEGKQLFNSNCAHCHGKKGDGNGPMVKSGAYAGVPNYSNLTNLGDGQIFYSIYYGKGMMGAHSSLLNKKEIWTLVHYVRKFQDPDYGNFDLNDASNLEQ
ncbi:MAG: hypothetical protein CL844_08790 [Crocinitomicaceae bacterium]|nr:hypothetical protein [Crocinitomicaceae bacterium]|tara:strand:- start:23195 stop:23911 length:717 start_codon:yes stop_codon:yes gene_type:complete